MKNLRSYWLLVLLLTVGGQVSAQEKSGLDEDNLCTFVAANFDKESFLIGTLDDYMGRQKAFTYGRDSSDLKKFILDIFFSERDNSKDLQRLKESTKEDRYTQFVDGYFPKEKHLALLIDSLFTGEFSDLRMVDKGGKGKCINLYSPLLSNVIDSYFEYRQDKARLTLFMDTLYTGYHKSEKLETVKQKLSFLAGAFLRSGYKTEPNKWYLSMPNSTSKAEFCSRLLKELDCTNVKYDILSDFIPIGHRVYFEPSESVNELVRKVEVMKEKLRSFGVSQAELISVIELEEL
jgi:hypothetical protein